MFNENKAVRIAIDDQYVACVRVLMPKMHHVHNRERVVLAIHLGKGYKEHTESVQLVMEAVKDIQKHLRERYHLPIDIMCDFYIPLKEKSLSFGEASSQWFGGTGVRGSASVPLTDDAGKPLF